MNEQEMSICENIEVMLFRMEYFVIMRKRGYSFLHWSSIPLSVPTNDVLNSEGNKKKHKIYCQHLLMQNYDFQKDRQVPVSIRTLSVSANNFLNSERNKKYESIFIDAKLRISKRPSRSFKFEIKYFFVTFDRLATFCTAGDFLLLTKVLRPQIILSYKLVFRRFNAFMFCTKCGQYKLLYIYSQILYQYY